MIGMYQAAQLVGLAAATVAPTQSVATNQVRLGSQTSGYINNSNCSISQSSATIAALRQQFASLHLLQDGWLGANSIAPNRETIAHAAYLLDRVLRPNVHVPAPLVAPVADGGIQAEWHVTGHRFEAYFEPDGTIAAWSGNSETGVEFEEEGTDAVQLLIDWVTSREYEALA